MKKTFILLSAAALTVLSACCNSEGLNVTPLRSAGKQIQNPCYNADQCKPEGSLETLQSIRYVDPYPIYYMDYTAEVNWDEMIFPAGTLDIYSIEKVYAKRDELLYNNPGKMGVPGKTGGACSGFVCHNPAGELLFGRNYDNHLDPLMVVFNKNVGPGEHKSVLMSDLKLSQSLDWNDELCAKDNCLLEPGMNLNVALRAPVMAVDGMNDAGLCIAAYQLPQFADPLNPVEETGSNKSPRPSAVKQETGKGQIQFFGLHTLVLTKCANVAETVDFFKSHDYAAIYQDLNLHYFVADAEGNYVVLEYWKDETGKDILRVIDLDERTDAACLSHELAPYGYNGIENFYCNRDAARTYPEDSWQNWYSPKIRLTTMMDHYSLVMTEEEALRCLQYGNFEIDIPGVPTAWSCVYNPKQLTVIFNMHDDLSYVWSIDLKKDLK